MEKRIEDVLLSPAEKVRANLLKKPKCKPLNELVIDAYFRVNDVVSQSYATSHTPQSEIRIGPGSSPVYDTGYRSELVLKVKPKDKSLPINTLKFDGFSDVKAGNYIKATIPLFEEIPTYLHHSYLRHSNVDGYASRKCTERESAIEIAILDKNLRVLRTDRSVDYNRFQKR